MKDKTSIRHQVKVLAAVAAFAVFEARCDLASYMDVFTGTADDVKDLHRTVVVREVADINKPIVVPMEARADYINALWSYQRAVGTISLASPALLPEPERLEPLKALLRDWWRPTLDLVAEARG